LLLLESLTIGSLYLAAVGSLPDQLRTMNDEAAALAQAANDPWHIAMVAALRGMEEYVAGHLELSAATLRDAIDAFTQLGDEATAGLFEISFCEVVELRGGIAEATIAMTRALAVDTDCGFRSSTVLCAALCWLAGRNGETERALNLGREVVAEAHQPFNPVIRAQALFALGVAETRAGLAEPAAEHLGEALRIHEHVGMVREAAMDHRHIGELRHMQGNSDEALSHHRRAVALAVQVGLPWTVILAARSMAPTLVEIDPELACHVLGNTEALSEMFGYDPTPEEQGVVDDVRAIATKQIGAAAVAKATAAGAQLDFKRLPELVS
ncbi:MAG TPA: tetratricopeptide repeat protein, partial [Ilumatobacteraceae bacterium]|nr:tetratricopeptide repeat protein [Ilumatobacteraceae bacterium]